MSSAYEKLIPPAKRMELQAVVYDRPDLKYYVPTLTALGNNIGGVFATVSYALRKKPELAEVVNMETLIDVITGHASPVLQKLGVDIGFMFPSGISAPLTVRTAFSAPSGARVFDYTFDKVDVSFAPNRAEAKALATERYARFLRTLKPEDVVAIFEGAQIGYSQFLTGDSPAEIKAKIKHSLAMERIKADPNYYLQRLKPENYGNMYDDGTEKYDIMFKEVGAPALAYGFEFAKNVLILITGRVPR